MGVLEIGGAVGGEGGVEQLTRQWRGSGEEKRGAVAERGRGWRPWWEERGDARTHSGEQQDMLFPCLHVCLHVLQLRPGAEAFGNRAWVLGGLVS